MWIRDPGKVVNGLDLLGTHEICLYLLRGKNAMIIGGGMSWIAPSLEAQLSVMDFEPDRLMYLVISHSHADHCGAVPYLKRKFPNMQVLASAHFERVLSKQKVVDSIATSNRQMIDKLGIQSEYESLNLKFDGIKVDQVVAEEDVIDLGDGIEAHFIEVPGHTKCSIAVYVPKLNALFPTDAAPFPLGDMNRLAHPSPQYDFSMYRESLEKLARYKAEICAFEHFGVFTGSQARKGLREGLHQTEEFRNHIVELYQQTGDIDEVAQQIASERTDRDILHFIDSDIWVTVSKIEIRNVLRYSKLLPDND